jgi:hypothetical protein
MQQETVGAVRAASAALERKSKVEALIAAEVAGLPELIDVRLTAERDLRTAECSKALGEPAPALGKAQKAAADARATLEQASLRLAGLRANLGGQGTELVSVWDRLATTLPEYNASIVAEFAGEWRAALGAWCEVLGRRAAIERVLGEALSLPDPSPTLVDVSELARPHETLAAVAGALKTLASVKAIAERPRDQHVFYDPGAVYKVVSERLVSRGVEKGALVVDCTFESGRLPRLLEMEQVRLIRISDLEPGVNAAARKAKEIEDARAAKELAESERKLHTSEGRQSTRRYDLEALDYTPSRADLDRIAEKNLQIAGRSIGPSDPEYSGH